MGDPLGRYLKYNKDQLGYMDKNGINPDDPLADALLPKDLLQPKDYRFESAMGRRDIEAETNARQLEQYKRSFETATGDRKTRLGKQIKELESQSGMFSVAPTLGESVKRFVGGAAGAIPQMFAGVGDLGLALTAEPLERGINKLGINTGAWSTKAREHLQETTAGIDEITGAKGIEGIAGSFAGAFGMGAANAATRAVSTSARVGAWSVSPNMIPRIAAGAIKTIEKGVNIANLPGQAYGEISHGTLRFLGKAAIFNKGARAALEGGRTARVVGSMIGDLPTNVMQALTLPDANPYDIARTIALGTAGSAVGGAFSSRTLFDQPKATPFDANLSTPATGKADPAMEALAARADRIAEWQAANPDKSWAKLEPSEQTAILGDVPVEAGQGWVRLEDQATALRSYIEGTMEDVDAAKAAFRALTQAGVKPDALVPMLGMTVQVQDGHVLLFDADGNVPNPERLLLASGEAPRALEAAARAQSDSKLKQPTVEIHPESRNEHYTWELPNGNVFHVAGNKVGDIFRIEWASANNGARSVGPRIIIQARQQLLDMTGATDVSGFRISGAKPGREAGAKTPVSADRLGEIQGLTDNDLLTGWVRAQGEFSHETRTWEKEAKRRGFTEDDAFKAMHEFTALMEANAKLADPNWDPANVSGMPRPAPELGRDGTNATDPTGDTPPQPGRGGTDRTPFNVDEAKAEWNAIQDRADDGLASPEEIRHGMELYNDIEAAGGWRAEDYVQDAPKADALKLDQISGSESRTRAPVDHFNDIVSGRWFAPDGSSRHIEARNIGGKLRVEEYYGHNVPDDTPIPQQILDDLMQTTGVKSIYYNDVSVAGDAAPSLKLSGKAKTGSAQSFMDEAQGSTRTNPMSDRERLFGPDEALGGVTMWVADENTVHLSDIRAITRGGGRKAMEQLIALADKHGVTLDGTVKPLASPGGVKMTQEKLTAWYKSFGFKADGEEIVRLPRNLRSAPEPEFGAEPATTPRPRPALTEPEAPLRPPTTDALETVTPRKPLDEMTLGELESLMNKVYSRFDTNPALMQTEGYRAAQRDAAKIGAVVKAKEARGPESQYALERPVDDNVLYSLITSDITKLSEGQLGELNVMLSAKIAKLDTSPEKDLLVDKLLELRNYQRTREVNTTPQKMASSKSEDIYDVLLRADMEKKPGRNDRGVATPQTVAAIASSSLGGLWGYVQGDEDTTNAERMRNAAIGAMVMGGAAVGAFAIKGRMHRQNIQKRAKLPGEAGLSAAMVSKHDETPGTVNAKIAASLTWHARLYQRISRPSLYGERVARILADGAEMGKQVGDMLASFGLWHHNTTEWTFNGPRQQNPDGSWTPVTTIRADGTIAEIKPLSQIIREVDGNMDMLGKTAMALSAIEHFTRTGKTPHPKLTPGDLSQFIAHVDQKFIAGAMAMRDMHLGMLDLQVRAGLITPEARAAMASERYYTALERVFGSAVEASAGEIFGEVGAKIREKIGSPMPVKSREGPNDWDIRNPVETLMHNIPRVMKAVELQDKKAALIALHESSNIPDALKNTIMKRHTVTQEERAYIEANQDKIDMLREYLPKISEEDALNMVATYDPTPLGPKSPYMTYIRNGKKEVWRLADDLTDTFQYMQGHEISAFAKLIGLTGDPLRLGIGFSPDFIARMAWFDVFQTYMNSKYGSSLRDMAPGVNWADAFYQIWVKSPEARNFGGGTAEGTMFEGMRSPEEIVRRAQAQGDTYGADIWRNVKQGDLPSAYKTLLIPFATAGRGSEFFADRRHGKSVQEAHRSANAVTGYYNQVGMYTAGLYRMIPFLKGTAQSLDQAFAASGFHPYRKYDTNSPWRVPGTDIKWGDKRKSMMWMAKGTVLASGIAAIYAANYGDEEIDQLRQTKQGRRFLFFRLPGGGIMSVRKPAGPEGVLFGSGVEIALDAWNGKEPEAVKEWVGAFRRELTLPFLPPVVAAAFTIGTGVDVSFGSPLVGTRAAKLPTELQSRTNTTEVAKTASSAIVNTFGDPGNGILGRAISPAGIDYVVRTLGGTLANEAFKLADFSRAWKETGSVPASQEWPIIRKFVTIDMTRQQTRDMQDFYEQVGDAERISNGMAASLEAGDIEGYNAIVKRAGPKVYTATLLLETRRDLVEFTRAIEEMKNMPGADPKYKREMILAFRKQIQLLMGQALDATRAIQD